MRRLAVAALLAGTALLVPAAPAAAACPGNASDSLQERLRAADGAIVAHMVKRSGRVRTYVLDTRVKGDIGTRVRVRATPGCAPAARKGRRIGLLLDRRSGRWHTASRALRPGELLKAAGIGP